MRWPFISRIIGILLVFTGLAMTAPLACSFYFKDLAHGGISKSIAITMAAGLGLILLSKKYEDEAYINQKEGMTVVALGWTAIGLFGACPFIFHLNLPTSPMLFLNSCRDLPPRAHQ